LIYKVVDIALVNFLSARILLGLVGAGSLHG